MSILIKGMEMPENCTLCPIITWYDGDGDYVCPFSGVSALNIGRQDDCPLVPVPPHGRLIDADALVEDLERQCKEVFRIDAVSPDDYWITRNEAYNEALWKTWVESFDNYLKTRPTVIPADKDGET